MKKIKDTTPIEARKCPACGSDKVASYLFWTTAGPVFVVFLCLDCGYRWMEEVACEVSAS